MKILLSNDDSVFAKGIATMHAALAKQHDVTVIAPDRNCSGASNALSLHQPLRIQKMDSGFFAVNGTPSDCVHLGVNSFLEEDPELVVSGINHGANLGDDVIYSGTVAAATEGRYMGLPAIAVSLCNYDGGHFETAARVVVEVIEKLITHPLPANQILNINVPNLPYEELAGEGYPSGATPPRRVYGKSQGRFWTANLLVWTGRGRTGCRTGNRFSRYRPWLLFCHPLKC